MQFIRRRPGLARAVLIMATLVMIATCKRKGWDIEATLIAIPDPTMATLMIVEASQGHQPSVVISPDSRFLAPQAGPVDHMLATKGPGTWSYLVPRGATIERVKISGRCGGTFCSAGAACHPGDAFVRIVSVTAVETWKLDATSAPITTALEPDHDNPTFTVKLSTTRLATVTTDVSGTVHKPAVSGGPDIYKIAWPSYSSLGPGSATWTVHAEIEGPCPSTNLCNPPPTDHLRILSVDEEEKKKKKPHP